VKIPGIATVIFKIFAEIKNEIVNGTGGRIYIITPNGLQYLFTRHHIIPVFDQQFQQHCFFLAQLYALPAFGHGFLRLEIYGIGTEPVHIAYRFFFVQFLVLADQLPGCRAW